MINPNKYIEPGGCIIAVVFIGAVVLLWDDISERFAEPIKDVKEAMTDCDELREELRNTKRCLSISNCTLTKDELIQYEEDELNWYRYCFDEHGSPP